MLRKAWIITILANYIAVETATHNLGDDVCRTSVDCSMNGECTVLRKKDTKQQVVVSGNCHCFSGWKGSRCEELDFLPVISHTGLQLSNNTSTWGGSVIYRQGMYHMFASEMVLQCGLEYWTTNSQVIRATSKMPYGPYKKQQVILPTFAHEPNVVEAPSGEIVLFVTASPPPSRVITPIDCRKSNGRSRSPQKLPQPRDTYMLWAFHPEGPWSEPVLVFNSSQWNADYWNKTHKLVWCDSNLNGIILNDSSFLGLWRRCETANLLTIPHRLWASNWKDPSTYQPHLEPLFVLGGSGSEDPSNIWTTRTSDVGLAYHALWHDEQSTRCMLGQCSANGRHAFSLDGVSWRYANTDAYNETIVFENGKTIRVDTRARPHVIIDPTNNQLLALSTGVQLDQTSGYVWTLVQPLRRSSFSMGKKKKVST